MPLATRRRGGSPLTFSPLTSIVPKSGASEAGERQLQLDLAVAVDAGDTEHLAGVHHQPIDRQPSDAQGRRSRPPHDHALRRVRPTGGSSSPTISWARLARVRAPTGAAGLTTTPLRSTATRSAASTTSRSRWVISTTARPSSASRRVTPSKRSASASVSTAVGSSSRRTSRIGVEGAQQLEALALADRHRRHGGGRIDVEARVVSASAVRSAAAPRSRRSPCSLGPEEQEVVDGDHRRHEGEVLLHEGHAALDGLPRRGRGVSLARPEDLAGVVPVESTEDAHQRRLARPVLAEDRQHLAGADVQVDVAERLHVAEAARDTDHLQGGLDSRLHCGGPATRG